MPHTHIEVRPNPQKSDAHGSDAQKTQGQETEPQAQDADVLALHESATGLQRVMSGTVRVIQQHEFGQAPGQGNQDCRDNGKQRPEHRIYQSRQQRTVPYRRYHRSP